MKHSMRIPAIIASALIASIPAHADRLSAPDREALIERLDQIRATAESKVDARYKLALAAYSNAAANETTAYEFYMKCIEKVNFADKDKKSSDFREWKRKNSDKHSESSFRLALRYQLRWLVMTLMVSPEDVDVADYASKATSMLDSIVSEAHNLTGNQNILTQNATSSIFARAYEIGSINKKGWPNGPGQLEQIYEDLVFPDLRTPSRTGELRNAWIKRIQQAIILNDAWSSNNNGKSRKGSLNPNARTLGGDNESSDVDKFMDETVPSLQWQMEVDVYKAGDESGAAMRMLAHIEKYISHKSSMKWSEEFTSLLMPSASPDPGKTPPPAPDHNT